MRRAAVSAIACAFAAGAPAANAQPRSWWTLKTVLSRIDGAKVIVGRWSGRVDADSTLCSGNGRALVRTRRRHWRHFTCTWTVFDRRGAVDRDVTFAVHVLAGRRFAITRGRFGPY